MRDDARREDWKRVILREAGRTCASDEDHLVLIFLKFCHVCACPLRLPYRICLVASCVILSHVFCRKNGHEHFFKQLSKLAHSGEVHPSCEKFVIEDQDHIVRSQRASAVSDLIDLMATLQSLPFDCTCAPLASFSCLRSGLMQMIMFNEYISSQVYKAQHESDRVRKRTPGLVYGCESPASCTCSDGCLPSFAVLKNRSPHSCHTASHHDFPAPYLCVVQLWTSSCVALRLLCAVDLIRILNCWISSWLCAKAAKFHPLFACCQRQSDAEDDPHLGFCF